MGGGNRERMYNVRYQLQALLRQPIRFQKSYCARGFKTLKISDRSLGDDIVCLLTVISGFFNPKHFSM